MYRLSLHSTRVPIPSQPPTAPAQRTVPTQGHRSAPDARGPAGRRSAGPEGPRLAEEASGDRQTQGWMDII